MAVIVSKDARTGEIVSREISEAEAFALGLMKTQAEIDAAKDAKADALLETRQETRVLALALVDMIYALRDGQLDAVDKPQAIQLLKQRVREKL